MAAPHGTPEQQAARRALRECLNDVRQDNPDADRAELRALARPCLEKAGLTGAGRERLKECAASVRQAHPGAGPRELRPLIKECLAG